MFATAATATAAAATAAAAATTAIAISIIVIVAAVVAAIIMFHVKLGFHHLHKDTNHIHSISIRDYLIYFGNSGSYKCMYETFPFV
jgi:succinate dehydrogenase/fumarate reductase cytochrome b subunit